MLGSGGIWIWVLLGFGCAELWVCDKFLSRFVAADAVAIASVGFCCAL